MPKSTLSRKGRKAATGRPSKPYLDFPLTPHPSRAWQKKILGEIHYSARWGHIVHGKMEVLLAEGGAWKESLALDKTQADDLHAGRTPRVRKTGDGLMLITTPQEPLPLLSPPVPRCRQRLGPLGRRAEAAVGRGQRRGRHSSPRPESTGPAPSPEPSQTVRVCSNTRFFNPLARSRSISISRGTKTPTLPFRSRN